MKTKIKYFLVIFSVLILPNLFSQSESFDPLKILMQGNERFVTGKMSSYSFVDERANLVNGQKPIVVVLTCSDSRVSPEYIFDQSLGKIFKIEVAGNVVDPILLGSIEYAVEHLNIGLLIVMGHQSCGAVKAAVEGGHLTPNISKLVEKIKVAVQKVKLTKPTEKELIHKCVEENVKLQAENCVKGSSILKHALHENKLKIVGVVYNLQTGKVENVPLTNIDF